MEEIPRSSKSHLAELRPREVKHPKDTQLTTRQLSARIRSPRCTDLGPVAFPPTPCNGVFSLKLPPWALADGHSVQH